MSLSDSSIPPTFEEVIRLVGMRRAEAREGYTQAVSRLSREGYDVRSDVRRAAEAAEREATLILLLLEDREFHAKLTVLDGHWQRFRMRHTSATPARFADAVMGAPEDETTNLLAVWRTIQRTITDKAQLVGQRSIVF